MSQFSIPTSLLEQLEPSDQPLFALIFEHVDDSMLVEIAHADYGEDVDLHLEALQQCRSQNIPIPMPWHPGEVLALTRWTTPEQLKSQGREIEQRGQWMRLFACTVMIWASLEPENYEYSYAHWANLEGEDSTIIQLIDSALSLGDEASVAALKFLSWRMQAQFQRALVDEDEDFGNCPCYAVAMLLLYVSIIGEAAALEPRSNPEIVNWLISIAHCNREYIPVSREINECLRSQKWQDTIHRILLDPTASNYARSNLELQSFGLELIYQH